MVNVQFWSKLIILLVVSFSLLFSRESIALLGNSSDCDEIASISITVQGKSAAAATVTKKGKYGTGISRYVDVAVEKAVNEALSQISPECLE